MDRRTILTTGLGLWVAALALPAPARAGGAAEKKKTGGDSYIAIPTLTATTIKSDGRRGVMTVDCGLDIADPALHQLATLSLPRLRAAYAQTVQIYAGGLPSGSIPNTDFLARTLQRQTDTALGKLGAKLLLGSVVVN